MKLVFYSTTITMMHGPINTRLCYIFVYPATSRRMLSP